MARSSSRGSFRGRRPRGGSARRSRPTEWIGAYLADQAALAVGAITSTQVLDADIAAFQASTEPTLVRTHGSLAITHDAVGGNGSLAHGAFGMIVADDPTSDEPVIYSPIDDADGDWFLHGYWQVQALHNPTVDLIAAGPISAERFQLDSAAMRKLSPRKSILFVIENDVASNFAIQWHAAFRYLLKE